MGTDSTSGMNIAMFGEFSGSDISGSWGTDTDESGTFTTDAGGDGGGGGGSGCFINALNN